MPRTPPSGSAGRRAASAKLAAEAARTCQAVRCTGSGLGLGSAGLIARWPGRRWRGWFRPAGRGGVRAPAAARRAPAVARSGHESSGRESGRRRGSRRSRAAAPDRRAAPRRRVGRPPIRRCPDRRPARRAREPGPARAWPLSSRCLREREGGDLLSAGERDAVGEIGIDDQRSHRDAGELELRGAARPGSARRRAPTRSRSRHRPVERRHGAEQRRDRCGAQPGKAAGEERRRGEQNEAAVGEPRASLGSEAGRERRRDEDEPDPPGLRGELRGEEDSERDGGRPAGRARSRPPPRRAASAAATPGRRTSRANVESARPSTLHVEAVPVQHERRRQRERCAGAEAGGRSGGELEAAEDEDREREERGHGRRPQATRGRQRGDEQRRRETESRMHRPARGVEERQRCEDGGGPERQEEGLRRRRRVRRRGPD